MTGLRVFARLIFPTTVLIAAIAACESAPARKRPPKGTDTSTAGDGGSMGSEGGAGGTGGTDGRANATGGAGGARPLDVPDAGGGSGGTVDARGDTGGTTDARMADTGAVQPSAPKLSTDVAPILKMKCALAPCHSPTKKEHGMDLSMPATILAGWVNKVTADHCKNNMAVTRVVPFKPENSFVVTLIEAPPGRCAEPARMPPAPLAKLTAAEVKTIRDWIAAGALND